MRRHLQVVLEKKIKNCSCPHEKSSIIGCATITFCAQTAYINIFMKSGLIFLNILHDLSCGYDQSSLPYTASLRTEVLKIEGC